MYDRTALEEAVRNACFAADRVAMGMPTASGAERTRAVIRSALESLEANGMIKIVPLNEWPSHFYPDPPYRMPEWANPDAKEA